MEIAPTALHQRTPLLIGSARDVKECMEFIHGRHESSKLERRTGTPAASREEMP